MSKDSVQHILLLTCLPLLATAFIGLETPVLSRECSQHTNFARKPTHSSPIFSSTTLSMAAEENEGGPLKSLGNLPLGPFVLALLAVQSSVNLFTRELPSIAVGTNPDYFGSLFDVAFLTYAAQSLLQQTGAVDSSSNDISLDGFECRVTLNIGREPGTWMDKDWAASGARLSLPVKLRFSDKQLDLGFPGEEGLGGRFCRKLEVLDSASVKFVGPQGEVSVPVEGGGWSALPILERKPDSGERKLRFFLDFPTGASRNDVTLPPGRVFFSSICFESAAEAPSELKMIESPSGTGVYTDGGLTIKKNGITNLYGALGEVNLILGRFSIDAFD